MVGKKIKEELETKLSVSKKLSTDLSFNLQQLSEKVMTCVQDTDTTEVEDVEYCNKLIKKINKVFESLSKTQNFEFQKIEFVRLTDEQGVVAEENKLYVVGEVYFTSDGNKVFSKRRKVEARTYKEAVYKYKKTDASLGTELTCFGEYDETQDYSQGIEIEDIIK